MWPGDRSGIRTDGDEYSIAAIDKPQLPVITIPNVTQNFRQVADNIMETPC